MGAPRRNTELSGRGQSGEVPQRIMSTQSVGNRFWMKGENRKERILEPSQPSHLGTMWSSLEDRNSQLWKLM